MRRLAVILLSTLLLVRCGTSIPYDQELFLKRPTGLQVTAVAGQKMLVQYTVQNQEETFDGYNLLISRVSIGDSEAFSMEPLTINGSTPTFLHSRSEFNVNTVRSVTVERFTNVLPFEVGTTYYFRLQAHSRKGVRSEASNEVTATGIP
ncbi:MAG: fibronectin type III domain-containing protein [Spirochaetota bacterium]